VSRFSKAGEVRGNPHFLQETLSTESGSAFGAEDFDCYLAAVLQVLSNVDGSYPTPNDFLLYRVAVADGSIQTLQWVSCGSAGYHILELKY
jgi:hypothetical protein